jgi:hypothetical protein
MGGVVSGNEVSRHPLVGWCHVTLSFLTGGVPGSDVEVVDIILVLVHAGRVVGLSLHTDSEFPWSVGRG